MASKSTQLFFLSLFVSAIVAVGVDVCSAQEHIPEDRDLFKYHQAPRYRESESHPLRVLAYAVHPIGWAARELIFRPLSYFAASTEETRTIMGFREPYDFRTPSCFARSGEVPDCRTVAPLAAARFPTVGNAANAENAEVAGKAIYFSDVNFDLNTRQLTALGKAKARTVAETLKQYGAVKVVLQGHADTRGGEAYNKKLGLDRAEAVKKELLALGVNAERLSTVSFGESKPLFTENEEWAHAANRRVEVHMSEDGAAAVAPSLATE